MKSSGIGGQAVLEGVMMRNKEKYAVAVRKPNQEIVVKVSEYRGVTDKFKLSKIPIIRGMAAFIDSMVLGISCLTYSSTFYEEEDEKEPNKVKDGLFTFFSILFSIVFGIGLFMLIPLFLSRLFSSWIDSSIIILLIEGLIKILLFIGYIFIISRLKDIKRFFMYHGAEHKVINCVERNAELTVKNVRASSKEHKRCGTSFMLYVIILSIIFFMFIQVDNNALRYILRILLVPFIAGIAYEFIRLAGSSDNIIIKILSKPGLWMQGLTTKEPDDDMIEVAIASVEAVFDWKAFQQGNKVKGSHKKNSSKGKNQKNTNSTVNQKAKNESKKIENITVPPVETVKVTSSEEKIAITKDNAAVAQAKISADEIAASLEQDTEEEEDEILKALDHYFLYNKEKK